MEPTLRTNDGRSLRAMVFDMDGVIVNSHPVHRKAWQQFLRLQGLEVSESELDYILDGRKRVDILCHFLGPLSQEQILEYGRRKDLFFQESESEVRPIAGVLDFVKHLAGHGKPMAVATSASESRTRFTLEQLELQSYFEAVLTNKDVQRGKPAPDIYQAACERIHVDPGNAVAFEDAVSGVVAAKAAGLKCVGVLTHQSDRDLRSAGADLAIPDFTGFCLTDLESSLSLSRSSPELKARR